MTPRRAIILALGPIVIVSVCYWLTLADGIESAPASGSETGTPEEFLPAAGKPQDRLREACEQTAAELRRRLGSECRVIVRKPFVLAGDLPDAVLDEHYRTTIVPTVRALATCYFDRESDEPISILMFSNEKNYRRSAAQIDGKSRASYHGYYEKQTRRIVLNIATGNGTLAHELTHALAHFDFPNMPEWFDEGLASLNEQSRFSDDGLQLFGLPNWRINYLLLAMQHGRLRSIHALVTDPAFGTQQEAVDYAQARYLCLYLQERGLLSHFYRKLRANTVHRFPLGYCAVAELSLE